MTIEEFKQILKDQKMSSKKTNIKILKDRSGGGNNGPKPPSTRQILIDFIKEQRKNWEEQRKVNAQNQKNWEEQRKFNQYVLDMFKKHKWI